MMLVILPLFASKLTSCTARTPPKCTDSPADHDDEEKENRLQERKRFGADEARQRCEYSAGQSGGDGGKSESGGADHGRIKSDRLAGDFGVAHGAHGLAPRALAQLRVE